MGWKENSKLINMFEEKKESNLFNQKSAQKEKEKNIK